MSNDFLWVEKYRPQTIEDCILSVDLKTTFHKIFQSLLGLNDIQVGFSIYNQHEDVFERAYTSGLDSFLLYKNEASKCADILCDWSQKRLLEEKRYFSISDVQILLDKSPAPHLKSLEDQGFRSAIFAPLANNDGLMGILEIVSKEPSVLNSISANKLEDVMPFIISAVERIKKDRKNLIEAIIQKECTSIHPSVHWRFEKEAKNFIKNELNGQNPVFNKIGFGLDFCSFNFLNPTNNFVKGSLSCNALNPGVFGELTLTAK